MTGTPSKDRAEAHMAAARMAAHLWLRDERTSLGEKMAMANYDVLAEHIAAALATSFAEGMKRAAEIARDYPFSDDAQLHSNQAVMWNGAQNIRDAILSELREAK